MWKFGETLSFRRVSGELPETPRKPCLSTNFDTRKLGQVWVLYAVISIVCYVKTNYHRTSLRNNMIHGFKTWKYGKINNDYTLLHQS